MQCVRNFLCILRAHQPGYFLPIPQKNQCRPQLHPVTAPQRLARAVFYLQVGDSTVCLQRLLNKGLRCQTKAAPRRAEFEQGGTGKAVHFGTDRRLDKVLGLVRHGTPNGAK